MPDDIGLQNVLARPHNRAMAIDYRTAGDALIVTRSPSPTGSTISYIYGPTSLVGFRPSRIRHARREWSLLGRIVDTDRHKASNADITKGADDGR